MPIPPGMVKPKTAKKSTPARRQPPSMVPDGDAAVRYGAAADAKAALDQRADFLGGA